MDPNANMLEQWSILADFEDGYGDPFRRQRLRELREALDAWILSGGFQPTVTRDLNSPEHHRFIPVHAQTGCAICGYALGHHPRKKSRRS